MRVLVAGDRENLAWVAGVFDGEGHVGRHSTRNTLFLDISQASEEGVPQMLTRVHSTVGFGYVRGPYGPYKISTRKPIYRYEVGGFEGV